MLVMPGVANIAIRPSFAVFRGLNKIKIPAIVTLLFGIVNLVLALLMVQYINLGIFGVAISLLISYTGNRIVLSIYTAIITGKTKLFYIKEILIGLIITVLLSFAAFALSKVFNLATIPRLVSITLLLFAIYAAICYFIILSKDEKDLLLSIVLRRG